MKLITQLTAVLGLVLFGFLGTASAHVTLDPKEAVIGRQAISIRVPNEKDIPTTELRIVVPDNTEVTGIQSIPGWTHKETRAAAEPGTTDEDGNPAQGRITGVIWTGGKINPGEFTVFTVNTNYTGQSQMVPWKSYQKYSDGTVVAWDGTDEALPAPTINIMNESRLDLLTHTITDQKNSPASDQTSLWFAFVAILFSVAAFIIALKSRGR